MYVAVALERTEVKVYNVKTGELFRSFSTHDDYPTALAFSPDNKSLAIGGINQYIIVRDLFTGVEKTLIMPPGAIIHSLVYSSDGSRLYCASGPMILTGGPGRITLWNPNTGTLLGEFAGHKSTVTSLAVSQDNSLLASGSANGEIKLWQANNGKLLSVFRGKSQNAIDGLAFSPETSLLANGSYQELNIWDLKTKKHSSVTPKPADWVHALVWSKNGMSLYSGEGDGSINELTRGALLKKTVLRIAGSPVLLSALGQDEKRVFSIDMHGEIRASVR